MTQFTLVRHSGFAVAADPRYEDALEPCEIDTQQAYRVRAAGGCLFETRQAADSAIAGLRGYFSSLRMGGAELFIPDPDRPA